MAVKQSVVLKGQRDGISIILDESVEFDALKESLRKKVSQGKRFFDGAGTKVSFKGRDISESEEQALIDIILEETSLDVTFVESSGYDSASGGGNDHDTPTGTKLNLVIPPGIGYMEGRASFYHGGLRAGQSIKYNGSVVILGDVNPGGEVVASGNVVVLGALKGMAHAGASGDDHCFVSALVLTPTQLRIGNTISYVPAPAKGVKPTPSYAYIKDGQVFVAALGNGQK